MSLASGSDGFTNVELKTELSLNTACIDSRNLGEKPDVASLEVRGFHAFLYTIINKGSRNIGNTLCSASYRTV
jgi:hypothetical protein